MLISDASSLILLAKSELLENLLSIHKIVIPPKVYEEVVARGLERNYPDAHLVNKY